MEIGAHNQIRRRFGRGIRGIRRIRRRFRKQSRIAQRAVHLIRGNMVETAFFIAGFDDGRRIHPMTAGGFQQIERSQNIRFDENFRPRDRIVHMAFRRKVDDAANIVFRKDFFNQFAVGDVPFDKSIARIALNFAQIAFVRRIRHLVQIDDVQIGIRL